MNNYNNPYNQYQYESPPRNPYYNQNNHPYYQANSYNNHKRSRHQWSSKHQGNQNPYPDQWAANSSQHWGRSVNPPSSVQNHYPSRNEYYRHEDMQFDPQINCSNNETARNQAVGETQWQKIPKRIQSITAKQSFVPSLLENEMTNESTSETKDEVVKSQQATFAEANKQILTKPTGYNSRQLNLLEAFSKPVESTKAERMMQMMGWKGGALGSNGQGLTEPLMPNIFQKRSAGFGVPEPKPDRKFQKKLIQPIISSPAQERLKKKIKRQELLSKKNQERKVKNKPDQQALIAAFPTNDHMIVLNQNIITKGFKRQYIKMRNRMIQRQKQDLRQKKNKSKRKRGVDELFKVRILTQILNFVNDESQTTLAFDKDLTKFQRKTVHDLVASIRENNDDSIANYDSLYMVDLMHEIMEVSAGCELFTESSGQFSDRQLHLYKSLPDHVYLITEDDLRILDDVDDCIVIDDDEIEEPVKANDEPEDHKTELNTCNEGVVKSDILNVQSNHLKIPTEGVNVKVEETIKNTSNETESCNNSVKTEILNDVQSQQSDDTKEATTQSAKVEDEDSIKKPTESIKRDISNDMAVEQNISTREQENNIKVVEDATQNKEIVKTPKEKMRETLIEFFKEFFNNDTYTEIRFSGDFSVLESDEIDTFMTNVELCIGNVNNCQYVWNSEDNLQEIFQNETYKLDIKVMPNSDVLVASCGNSSDKTNKTSKGISFHSLLKVPRNKKESEDELSESD